MADKHTIEAICQRLENYTFGNDNDLNQNILTVDVKRDIDDLKEIISDNCGAVRALFSIYIDNFGNGEDRDAAELSTLVKGISYSGFDVSNPEGGDTDIDRVWREISQKSSEDNSETTLNGEIKDLLNTLASDVRGIASALPAGNEWNSIKDKCMGAVSGSLESIPDAVKEKNISTGRDVLFSRVADSDGNNSYGIHNDLSVRDTGVLADRFGFSLEGNVVAEPEGFANLKDTLDALDARIDTLNELHKSDKNSPEFYSTDREHLKDAITRYKEGNLVEKPQEMKAALGKYAEAEQRLYGVSIIDPDKIQNIIDRGFENRPVEPAAHSDVDRGGFSRAGHSIETGQGQVNWEEVRGGDAQQSNLSVETASASMHGRSIIWEPTSDSRINSYIEARNEYIKDSAIFPTYRMNPAYCYAEMRAVLSAASNHVPINGKVPGVFECYHAINQFAHVNLLEFAVLSIIDGIVKAVSGDPNDNVANDALPDTEVTVHGAEDIHETEKRDNVETVRQDVVAEAESGQGNAAEGQESIGQRDAWGTDESRVHDSYETAVPEEDDHTPAGTENIPAADKQDVQLDVTDKKTDYSDEAAVFAETYSRAETEPGAAERPETSFETYPQDEIRTDTYIGNDPSDETAASDAGYAEQDAGYAENAMTRYEEPRDDTQEISDGTMAQTGYEGNQEMPETFQVPGTEPASDAAEEPPSLDPELQNPENTGTENVNLDPVQESDEKSFDTDRIIDAISDCFFSDTFGFLDLLGIEIGTDDNGEPVTLKSAIDNGDYSASDIAGFIASAEADSAPGLTNDELAVDSAASLIDSMQNYLGTDDLAGMVAENVSLLLNPDIQDELSGKLSGALVDVAGATGYDAEQTYSQEELSSAGNAVIADSLPVVSDELDSVIEEQRIDDGIEARTDQGIEAAKAGADFDSSYNNPQDIEEGQPVSDLAENLFQDQTAYDSPQAVQPQVDASTYDDLYGDVYAGNADSEEDDI